MHSRSTGLEPRPHPRRGAGLAAPSMTFSSQPVCAVGVSTLPYSLGVRRVPETQHSKVHLTEGSGWQAPPEDEPPETLQQERGAQGLSRPPGQASPGLRASPGHWARVSPGRALDESLMTWGPGAAGLGCAGRRKRRGLIKGGSQKPPGLPLPAFRAAGLVPGRGWAGGCSRRLWVCGPAWMAPGTPCDR